MDLDGKTFKKLAALAGLPPVRLHDLRHGAASHPQVNRSSRPDPAHTSLTQA